ncbi:hypothetical protein O9X99_19505, partial [Agrobacterium salinitolerans]|nr:hypothetical protein [Agrobacterium salinitolerans]
VTPHRIGKRLTLAIERPAAGDAVLRAAGGRTLDCEGKPLAYAVRGDGEDALANPDFIAEGAMAVEQAG